MVQIVHWQKSTYSKPNVAWVAKYLQELDLLTALNSTWLYLDCHWFRPALVQVLYKTA